MELNKLLSGNILIGSRSIGKGKSTSDWDIICDSGTVDFALYEGDIEEHVEHGCGYDICMQVMSEEEFDNCDECFEESDQGGFGADLIAIHSIKFKNGLYVNLFEYPNKRKWKSWKKLVRELRIELLECKRVGLDVNREIWVDLFKDLQYYFGINKDKRKTKGTNNGY